jgi:hypothetical protein
MGGRILNREKREKRERGKTLGQKDETLICTDRLPADVAAKKMQVPKVETYLM